MADLTYTVTPLSGSFTTSKIDVKAHLPKLAGGDSYIFPKIYDISNNDGPTRFNALLFCIKRAMEDGRGLSWNGTDPDVQVPVVTPGGTNVIKHTASPGLDWFAHDTLILIYHDEIITQADIDYEQKHVPESFKAVQDSGPLCLPRIIGHLRGSIFEQIQQSGILDEEDSRIFEMSARFFFNPKKIGMTIITKP